MLTGFNTDVNHKGRVYHVQTEDKGQDNPIIETLIYSGGEIIEARRVSYQQIIEKKGFQPQLIQKIMEHQHKLALGDIRSGKFSEPAPPPPSPMEEMFDKRKSLDEVILEYLANQTQQENLVLDYDRDRFFYEGEQIALPVKVLTEVSRKPVANAQFIVRVLSTVRPALNIFDGFTNENGEVLARFKIPDFPDGMAALIFQVFYEAQSSEEKVLLMRRVGNPSPTS